MLLSTLCPCNLSIMPRTCMTISHKNQIAIMKILKITCLHHSDPIIVHVRCSLCKSFLSVRVAIGFWVLCNTNLWPKISFDVSKFFFVLLSVFFYHMLNYEGWALVIIQTEVKKNIQVSSFSFAWCQVTVIIIQGLWSKGA